MPAALLNAWCDAAFMNDAPGTAELPGGGWTLNSHCSFSTLPCDDLWFKKNKLSKK